MEKTRLSPSSCRIYTLSSRGHPAYLLADGNLNVYPLAGSYLKYMDALHYSPNTCRLAAVSLCLYYRYLETLDTCPGNISSLLPASQEAHFALFLQWLLERGEERGRACAKTCNLYLRHVFGFYGYLGRTGKAQPLQVFSRAVICYPLSRFRDADGLTFRSYLKEEDTVRHTLTKEQADALEGACTNRRDVLILQLLLETGVRIGELLGIRYTSDIDYEKRTIRVRYRENNVNLARAKYAQEREVMFCEKTLSLLDAYICEYHALLHKTDYLFVRLKGKRKGEPLGAGDVYNMMRRLCKKTGLHVYPHLFRHCFAGERRRAGWEINDIRMALGHSLEQTTLLYLGDDPERLSRLTGELFAAEEELLSLDHFL